MLFDEQSTSALRKENRAYSLAPQVRQLRVLPGVAILFFLLDYVVVILFLLGPKICCAILSYGNKRKPSLDGAWDWRSWHSRVDLDRYLDQSVMQCVRAYLKGVDQMVLIMHEQPVHDTVGD